jgi:hypothetical protein
MTSTKRVEQFTDGEITLIVDALQELLSLKHAALHTANDGFPEHAAYRFAPEDFAIPQIEALQKEFEAEEL